MSRTTTATATHHATLLEAHVTSAAAHSPHQLRLALQECASDAPIALDAVQATWERLAALR